MEGSLWTVKVRRRLRMETVGGAALGDRCASSGRSGAISGLCARLETDVCVGTCEVHALDGGSTHGRISTALFVTQAKVFSLKEQAIKTCRTDLLFRRTCGTFARSAFFGFADISKNTVTTATKTRILAIGGLCAFFGADAIGASGTFGDTTVSVDTSDIFVVDLPTGFVGASELALGFAVLFVGFDFGTSDARWAIGVLAARQITRSFHHSLTTALKTGPTRIIQGSAAVVRACFARRYAMTRSANFARCTFPIVGTRLPTQLLSVLSIGLLDTRQPLFATCGGRGTIFAFLETGSLFGVDLSSIGVFGDALAHRAITDLRDGIAVKVCFAFFRTLAFLAIQRTVVLFGAQQTIRITRASSSDIPQSNALSGLAHHIRCCAIRRDHTLIFFLFFWTPYSIREYPQTQTHIPDQPTQTRRSFPLHPFLPTRSDRNNGLFQKHNPTISIRWLLSRRILRHLGVFRDAQSSTEPFPLQSAFVIYLVQGHKSKTETSRPMLRPLTRHRRNTTRGPS